MIEEMVCRSHKGNCHKLLYKQLTNFNTYLNLFTPNKTALKRVTMYNIFYLTRKRYPARFNDPTGVGTRPA